jgi:predicted nucleotidyltransferase
LKNIDRLKIICSAHNVDKMYLFGSALNSNFNDNSDIDFLVKFNHLNYLSTDNYINLKENLKTCLEERLIYWKSKHSKPNFNKLINKSKELIYG